MKERKIHFPVQIAKNLVGIKEDIGSLEGQAALKQEIIGDVALEVLFGTTSDTYLKLYNEGIIDDTFGYDYTLQDSFSFVLVGGDAKDPDKQTEKIKEAMKEAAKNGLNESDLALVKRKRIGQFCVR